MTVVASKSYDGSCGSRYAGLEQSADPENEKKEKR